MPRPKRSEISADARRFNREHLAALGGELKKSRKRRRLTQQKLCEMVGLSQSSISALERGDGGSFSMDTWQRVFTALERPLRFDVALDPMQDVADAGHL